MTTRIVDPKLVAEAVSILKKKNQLKCQLNAVQQQCAAAERRLKAYSLQTRNVYVAKERLEKRRSEVKELIDDTDKAEKMQKKYYCIGEQLADVYAKLSRLHKAQVQAQDKLIYLEEEALQLQLQQLEAHALGASVQYRIVQQIAGQVPAGFLQEATFTVTKKGGITVRHYLGGWHISPDGKVAALPLPALAAV